MKMGSGTGVRARGSGADDGSGGCCCCCGAVGGGVVDWKLGFKGMAFFWREN